jgi:hypothetical protein
MRTEHEFNAMVSKKIQLMGTTYYAIKQSERYHIGVSDWTIYHGNKAIAVEAKFIKKEPSLRATRSLTHPLTGPQNTFLTMMRLAGITGVVLIGVADNFTVRVAVPGNFNKDGNISGEVFHRLSKLPFSAIPMIIESFFSGYVEVPFWCK